MSPHATLYTRLTRKGRTLLAQMHELFDLACQSGCEIMATLVDDEAGQQRHDRRDLAQILNGMPRSDVGMVLAWTVDRSGRSRQHLVIMPARDRRIHY